MWKSGCRMLTPKIWVRFLSEREIVILVYCDVCRKNINWTVKAMQNFSAAFANGIRRADIKRDNIMKNAISTRNKFSICQLNKPQTQN